ncbi:MAG: hypothetical protein K0S47_3835 [Herbinix sp.]|jgi:formyltetrahydrofolate hydrolase|nr:hypothetical protein [Herbinix sp.]
MLSTFQEKQHDWKKYWKIKTWNYLTNIKFVFSDDEKSQYLEEKLKIFNIPYELLIVEKGQKNLRLSNELLEVLRKYQIDYCFSFGDHILKVNC